MASVILLAKLKFDLRKPDEAYLAKYELSSILGCEVTPVKTIPALFKVEPLNRLSDEVIHVISRNVYLGEVQGYMTKVDQVDIKKLVFAPAFFREIYLIFEGEIDGVIQLQDISENLYQVFVNGNMLVIRLFPVQTLFEYVTDVMKLPKVAITPKNTKSWDEYFRIKEIGIEEGLDALFEHIRFGHRRSPHFGLGKEHIGDFIDWASTDLRKPFLHYLHKYKGKGDPRISRALINILRVKEGETILDPFVGSGAFIADAPSMGINAIGVEILEIGKLISEVKCNLKYDIANLRNAIIRLFEYINYRGGLFDLSLEEINFHKNGELSQNIRKHVKDIIFLKTFINKIPNEKEKKFLLVLLSQKIVEFSEKKSSNNFVDSFQKYVEDRYLTLYATLKLAERLDLNLSRSEIKIIRADSTQMDFIGSSSIDGILTSPPYFDALDYVQNNRDSIILLGLDEDLNFSSTADHFSKFQKIALKLPESSLRLIELLHKSRRAGKAEIVENYLKMMKLSFRECYRVLKSGRFYAMVVSKYHTWTVQGKEQKIETSKIIVDIGISEGFKLVDVISHDISKADKGRINSEDILLFKKE